MNFTKEQIDEIHSFSTWKNFSEHFLPGDYNPFENNICYASADQVKYYYLWMTIFHNDKTLLLAYPNSRMLSIEGLYAIVDAYENISGNLRFILPKIVVHQKTRIEFENNMRIYAISDTMQFRGLSVNAIAMCDSLVSQKNKDLWKSSVLPSLRDGAKLINFS